MSAAVESLHGPLRGGWIGAAGVAASSLALASLWTALDAPLLRGDPAPYAVSVTLMALGAIPLRAALARVAGVSASSAAACALLPALVSTTLAPLIASRKTIVRSTGEGYADTVEAAFAVALVALAALVTCVYLFSVPQHAADQPSRRLRVGWASLLAAVTLLACARTAAQPPALDVAEYFQRAERVTIPEVSPASRARFDAGYVVGPAHLRRVCHQGGCRLWMQPMDEAAPGEVWWVAHQAAEALHVAPAGAVVFTSEGSRQALATATATPVNLRVAQLRVGRAPPWPWTLAAFAGLAAAALLRARYRRPSDALLRWRGAREGLLNDEGTVVFDDGAELRLSGAVGVEPGPVLLRFTHHDGASPFRGAHARAPEAVASGTRADVDAAVANVADSADSLALMVATTACAPLLVEALAQVFG